MNKYEAIYIFPETLKEAALDEAVGKAKAEIKKLDGDVTSATRLGKRTFARRLKGKEAGNYFLLTFTMDGDKIKPLLARYKLIEDIFRVQVVRAGAPVAPSDSAKAEEGRKNDGT